MNICGHRAIAWFLVEEQSYKWLSNMWLTKGYRQTRKALRNHGNSQVRKEASDKVAHRRCSLKITYARAIQALKSRDCASVLFKNKKTVSTIIDIEDRQKTEKLLPYLSWKKTTGYGVFQPNKIQTNRFLGIKKATIKLFFLNNL